MLADLRGLLPPAPRRAASEPHRRRSAALPAFLGALPSGRRRATRRFDSRQPDPAGDHPAPARRRGRPLLPGEPRGPARTQRRHPRRGPFRPHDRIPRRRPPSRPGDPRHAHPHPREPRSGAAARRRPARPTARFTFNRLSQVGEAAGLALPEPQEFAAFLERYLAARRTNPVFGFKDNLFNIVRRTASAGGPFPAARASAAGRRSISSRCCPTAKSTPAASIPRRWATSGRPASPRIYALAHRPALSRRRRGLSRLPARNACGGCPAVTFGQGLDPAARP